MIVYSELYQEHDMRGHPENSLRLERIREHLLREGVFELVETARPRKASIRDLTRVHRAGYVESIRSLCKKGMQVHGDTYFTERSFDTALLAAGGVLTAIDGESKSSFALIRPPGHHATPTAAMGFCIFNNVAVGAAYARERGFEPVAILDFDVHHGNGTQEMFYAEDVLYISLHQWPHYPGTGAVHETGMGRGEGYTVNIPLPPGAGDRSYKLALEKVVYPVLKQHSPELLLVSAGYDAHYRDPLSNLRLTSKTYLDIASHVKRLPAKVVYALEGGYEPHALARCVHASMEGLFGIPCRERGEDAEEESGAFELAQRRLEELRDILSQTWSL